MAALRSYLYVPGNKPALFEKADVGPADAIILDLEDAVPVAEKDAARDTVAQWLSERTAGKPVWVRVNPGAAGLDDLDAIAPHRALGGVVAAKADLDSVTALTGRLRAHGATAPVSPLLETPGAVLEAERIAAVDGVRMLQIGEYDLVAEVGIRPGPEETELLWARSRVVFASGAAAVEAPVAPVSIEIADLERLEHTTRALARLGFMGRACIHPAQIEVVHRVFTPAPEEVAAAARALELYDAALAAGTGVVKDDDGRMIDEATIRRSRAVVALAEAAGA